MNSNDDVLARLYATLLERKSADPETSYVARLFRDGLDAILKKVGEEATETVLAAKSEDRDALIHELADLWFHSLVLMAERGITPEDVAGELSRRMGQSGLAEKAARSGGK